MSDSDTFDRRFFGEGQAIRRVGGGSIGGKAKGLEQIAEVLAREIDPAEFPGLELTVPKMVVLGTDVFDAFVEQNDLASVASAGRSDGRIAHAFVQATFPARYVGDLRAVADEVTTPLAVRSSSLLEDAIFRPFAGVYATKMIPNNQADPTTRFTRLVEAVKLVYASTFFREAVAYRRSIGRDAGDEKMAVIIQEIVGLRRNDRFYPTLSGVARSYNFYPHPGGRAEDGVVDLALGLGKTIVDGGRAWSYSPARPTAPPPFKSTGDLLKNTQTEFWAVNMGPPPPHDPTQETEYLCRAGLQEAEYDNSLRHVVSTYDPQRDRLVLGAVGRGPRVLNFGPVLTLPDVPLNDLVRAVLDCCRAALGIDVEIEFAATLPVGGDAAPRLGLVQVRPMVVASSNLEVPEERLRAADAVLASEQVLGHGARDDITDVVYLPPDQFDPAATSAIAWEIAELNEGLVREGRPYLLIGFGRWGTTDKFAGVPTVWSQIAGARVIVEVGLADQPAGLSQGSHFFHNVTSFEVFYFSVPQGSPVDWDYLAAQEEIASTEHARHVRCAEPLAIAVDGRHHRGVIARRG